MMVGVGTGVGDGVGVGDRLGTGVGDKVDVGVGSGVGPTCARADDEIVTPVSNAVQAIATAILRAAPVVIARSGHDEQRMNAILAGPEKRTKSQWFRAICPKFP
jgi:hypothetical protein